MLGYVASTVAAVARLLAAAEELAAGGRLDDRQALRHLRAVADQLAR